MSKKHIFLRFFSKITIFACVFCAFFISPVFATLPAGYTELEYIESTGTQWIDTETKVSDKTKNATIEFKGNWFLNVSFSPFGAQKSNTRTFCTFESKLYCGDGTTRGSYVIPTDNNIHTLKGEWSANSDTLTIYVDNVVQGTSVQSGLFADANMYICTINGGSGMKAFSGYVYSVKLTVSDVLVRNFIPAKRNSDGEVGMYDMVSGQFFTNSGTGDFIAGPVAEIKIATTKMVDEEFAAAEANLAATVQTIESVVSRTISQTEQIQVLQDTKQTRPDESCPANMKCLLVQDEDGTPHWYPIIEP